MGKLDAQDRYQARRRLEVGIYGSPGGGHTSVACRSPITDPYARWQQAEKMKHDNLVNASKFYFQRHVVDRRDDSARGELQRCHLDV